MHLNDAVVVEDLQCAARRELEKAGRADEMILCRRKANNTVAVEEAVVPPVVHFEALAANEVLIMVPVARAIVFEARTRHEAQ
jgi:hypothetical protein